LNQIEVFVPAIGVDDVFLLVELVEKDLIHKLWDFLIEQFGLAGFLHGGTVLILKAQ